jgi:hypothetical protein
MIILHIEECIDSRLSLVANIKVIFLGEIGQLLFDIFGIKIIKTVSTDLLKTLFYVYFLSFILLKGVELISL